ncbi:MAG: glycosyltransferase family 4 protein [Pyrinomonadaceae bacterium]
MRVLFYLDSLGRGGAEMQALDVCRNAARFGIELTMAAGRGGALEAEFADCGVEFIQLERRLPVDIYLASQLRRIIREREIKVVHGHQAVDGLHLYLATRGLRKVRKVLTFHGFIADRRNRITSRFLITRMDANIVVSRGLQKWLADKDRLDTARNFSVIYNGVDRERLRPTGKSLRDELDVPARSLLVGMIGNFYRDPRKDQLTVCRALLEIFRNSPDVQCVFAGRVEDGAEGKFADCLSFCVENEIVDRVHFLGGRGDVADILASLDIFILSSLQEGLPIAIFEAMLAEVPMVLSDIEPHIEVSRNGEFAEIFPVGDAHVLARKTLALLNDKKRRAALARKAGDLAREKFSIDAHLGELKKLYERLTASRQ